MTSLLFVTPETEGPPRGGRALLSALHERALFDLLGPGFAKHALHTPTPSGWRGALGKLRGQIDGVTRASETALIERIAQEGTETVYLDGSNLGWLARAIKRRAPATRVITLFHNVEALFFFGALRHTKNLRAAAVLFANFFAERLAVKFSDQRIALNRRDSDALKKLYGQRASHIVPLAVADTLNPERFASTSRPFGPKYALFVGGGFYANRAGVAWFSREVAPHVGVTLCVVGRDLEGLRRQLEDTPNVNLIGEVEELDNWYKHATVVVAPIFGGSGMKTKVAEALMYGKHIVGTSEAFTGYEEVVAEAGWQCESANDFVCALKNIVAMNLPEFDSALRLRFDELYSYEAVRRRIAIIINPGFSAMPVSW